MSSRAVDSDFAFDSPIVQFGSYVLNVGERALSRAGQSVSLEPKTLDLLIYLVIKRDSLVTKDEILEHVWSSSFVEEANLPVHISRLRKIFAADDPLVVVIETLPRWGYRLRIETKVNFANHENQITSDLPPSEIRNRIGVRSQPELTADLTMPPRKPRSRGAFVGGLVTGIAMAAIAFFMYSWLFLRPVTIPSKPHSFKTISCPRETGSSNLAIGGCDEAVTSFSLGSNPNGSWSYGYSPKGEPSAFTLFDRAEHNNHFGSPELPIDMWRRNDEWHPLILRNTSHLTIVIQDGVVLPPNIFEMHPGPNGERSQLRWTAPADGHYRAQGQFRGLNTNGYTSTDALVIENGREVRFAENISGYNEEKDFDLTFKMTAGETIDFSVGYGPNFSYEGDSTGFSVIITTISLSAGPLSSP